MKAITTCVGYDDYLSISLPKNRSYFTDYYVITSPEDIATQKICSNYDVHLIKTAAFTVEGAAFNKGKAINVALNEIQTGWVCHLDADIVIQNSFPENLAKDTIYGCPRLMCPDVAGWQTFLKNGITKRWQKLSPSYFRIKDIVYNQYLPIGYTQIFNLDVIKPPYYPETSNNAARSDVEFSLKWDKHCCLKDAVIHLPQVDISTEGANWNGRKTPRFQ